MIIRHLARSKYLSSLSFTSLLYWDFVTCQKLLSASKKLINMDSLQIDRLSQNVLSTYQRPKRQRVKVIPQKSKKNQEILFLKSTQEKAEPIQPSVYSEYSDIDINQNTTNQQIIKFLYDFSSDADVGFLKGDIHSQFIFHLHKLMSRKSPKQLRLDVTKSDMKKIILAITDLRNYRLPKLGIKDSQKQDFINLYERQLFLQSASHQLSSERADNVLDSLAKIGKLHLVSAFQVYLNQWFPPLCSAIKQQQERCRNPEHLTTSRKIYAKQFLKLSADRLATVCLSELLKQVVTVMIKDSNKQNLNPELKQEKQKLKKKEIKQYDHFQQIHFNRFCMAIAKWVSVQNQYEKAQQKFKSVMKIFDHIYAKKVQNLQKLAKIKKQYENLLHKKQINLKNLTEEQIKKQLVKINQQQQKIKKQYDSETKHTRKVYKQNFVAIENRKRHLQDLAAKMIKNGRTKQEMAPQIQFEIGSVLLYMMKQIIKIENRSGHKIPLLVIDHSYNKRSNQITYRKSIKINDHFMNILLPVLQKQDSLFLHLDRSIPTIIPPMRWVQYQIGGYYLNPSIVMKFSNCKVQERLVKYADLSRLYEVLNKLSRVQWKINRKVLNIIQQIWIQGGNVGEIPKRYSELISPYLMKQRLQKNLIIQAQLQKKMQLIRDEHSLRGDFNLKINLARSFALLDRFYFPHHIDFRGRVYPIPPHLNHIGNDLSRGLLLFAKGKRLGEGGLKWLKIHCANLMGKDKATIEQKIEFTQANIGLIHDIAQNPLKNRSWLEYEDCWQALAAIFELDEALKQPVPQQFISSLHIHQDGSCNGLQHYAALGRDVEGANQVNLAPTQRPGDVYTYVAKMIIEMVQKDIQDVNSLHHQLAKKVKGNIKRKTIKQTVMTSVYGVTFIGAREQIYKQIKDQGFLPNQSEQYAASIYLAQYTLKAIQNLFSGAHQIKKWLLQCGKLITNEGNPIGWITPIGLPVVQPYRKETQTDVVNTVVKNLKLTKSSQNLPVDKTRQRSAFPPNFVHSLDSTHMMYTAQSCINNGIVFAAVHDSYWTHASTVDQMNQLLRKQFIKLHSQPLLQNLRNSLKQRYPQVEFPEVPKRGDFDLTKVKESVYFFS